jgi:hypothetical protein
MSKVAYLMSQQTADDIHRILEGVSAQARLLGNILEGCKRPVQAPPVEEEPTPAPAPEGA